MQERFIYKEKEEMIILLCTDLIKNLLLKPPYKCACIKKKTFKFSVTGFHYVLTSHVCGPTHTLPLPPQKDWGGGP